MSHHFLKLSLVVLTLVLTVFICLPNQVGAIFTAGAPVTPAPPPDLSHVGSLKSIPVPGPSPAELDNFIADKNKAIALGKALFWDMQIGSDGIQACATCHFHAGADNRRKNQLSPGLNAGDSTFQLGGPNYVLQPSDFPFRKLADVDDRHSTVISDTNDVTSSQGMFSTQFLDINPGQAEDWGNLSPDSIFNLSGVNIRRVEPRNTPTTINAVFNFRNFWDGRAQNEFNGVNPFGQRDVNAKVLKSVSGNLQAVSISLQDSSLASQAVGPPLSDFEMSHAGRDFHKLGKKMLLLKPLAKQQVAVDDSSLAAFRDASGYGLNMSYEALIKMAFKSMWWDGTQIVTREKSTAPYKGSSDKLIFKAHPGRALTTDEFTQMEANFSLFFGLAIQMYEATLVADDSPFDQYMDGNAGALTAQQIRGLDLFTGKAKCVACHSGPELTNASVRNVRNELIERMIMGDNNVAVYDNGFYNIGVRPTKEDIGLGGTDPFGNPLSFSGFFQSRNIPFPIAANVDDNIPAAPLSPTERIAVNGAFKTPGLRNVELTAPYFHNGGQATLMQVVEFYNRGGDFADQNRRDLDPDIQPLGLTQSEKEDLVAFLLALTDDRVRTDKKPFDHPSLFVPEMQMKNYHDASSRQGSDAFRLLAMVGQNGYSQATPSFLNQPSGNFLEQAPCGAVTISPATLPSQLLFGTPYSQAFTGLGTGTVTLRAEGDLPPGLTFDGTTLAGTPNQTGVFSFRLIGTDTNGCSTVCDFKIAVVPNAPAVSDQKAGSMLVFPYYTSNSQTKADTRITISNVGTETTIVHLFLMEKSCTQADQFVCLTPNASLALKMSELDPEMTGWVLAVAVNNYGVPVQQNNLIGNAFVSDGQYVDNYGAEAFRKHSRFTPITYGTSGDTAKLALNDVDYDAAPSQYSIEIQSPVDAVGQRIVSVGLNGSVIDGLSGAGQVGIGQIYNGNEKPFGSFSAFLTGKCFALATIDTKTPRVPLGMDKVVPAGQVGTVKFNTGGAVGLIMTPRGNAWSGIRTLHTTATTNTSIVIPVFIPTCNY